MGWLRKLGGNACNRFCRRKLKGFCNVVGAYACSRPPVRLGLFLAGFFDVDADCMGITEHIDWRLNSQWGELLSRSGTSMFISVAPDSLSAEQEEALRRMLAVNSHPHEIARPLDWQETTLPRIWQIDGETVTFNWHGARGQRVSFDDQPLTEDDQ